MASCSRYHHALALACLLALAIPIGGSGGGQEAVSGGGLPVSQRPVFGSRVDAIVVNATVTDRDGRFVQDLQRDDFELYEDGRRQPISVFSNERVPVSIGIALDLSNSMKGEKMRAARSALARLLSDLLDPRDEIFLYCFNDEPVLLQGWTTRRDLLRNALERVSAGGLTALYDATASAVALAATGRHMKKALLIISDGTDTASHTDIEALKRRIDESEVLVYAIGIDALGRVHDSADSPPYQPVGYPLGPGSPQWPPRFPGQPPPGQPRPPRRPLPPEPPRAPIPRDGTYGGGEVDAPALRMLTDDSGGRTAVIRSPDDLGPATAGIADELSRQYFLGYQGVAAHDGKWHGVEVRVHRPGVRVRARKGYVAGTS